MDAKPAIVLAGAITLISIGVVFLRPSASPVLESAGDASPTGKQRVSAPQRFFAQFRHQARAFPSEDDPESVRQLAQSNLPAAASWATQFPVGPLRVEAIKAVAIAWAGQDLRGAVEWGRGLADESERQIALLAVGFEAARTEPLTALALAIELNADPDRDELIRHAVGEWAVASPRAAAEWASRIEDSSLRARTTATIATTWAEMDPRAAATLAIEELDSGRIQEDTLVSIVERWAQREPADAASWITTFEEGELRAAAVHNLVKLWADQSPTGVGEWLKALPPGSIRDVAIAAYVEQIAPTFPQQASQWAELARANSPSDDR
jgi:hypothetical protein